MLIATWNVNSIKSRRSHVLKWAKKHRPDVLFLQELKGLDFPEKDFADLGYNIETSSQRTYNGVAILSLHPINVISRSLQGDSEDEQARYLEADIEGLRLINIYLPNGNPIKTEKFDYKLAWMVRLKSRMAQLKKQKIQAIIGGDYNVIPHDIDCFSPKYWKSNALFQPQARDMFQNMIAIGYIDAFRHFNQEPGQYTFWEYFLDHWKHNRGIRIDHFLVAEGLKARMTGCMIDRAPRGEIRPSDHAPIVLAIK